MEEKIIPYTEQLRFFCLVIHRRLEELIVNRPAENPEFRELLIAPKSASLEGLSPREKEVLYLIAQGISRKECARLCGISPHTVAEYTKGAYRKLGVSNRVEAANLVLRSGQSEGT